MRHTEWCFCGSNTSFEHCCLPLIEGVKTATTAEQLMRSRYAAYCTISVDYLIESTHSSTRKHYSKASIREWAEACTWIKLEIHAFTETTVTFSAHFLDEDRIPQVHKEHSTFKNEQNQWYFVDGVVSE